MKIAVLISGGVDSSVALMNLAKQEHEITAFYLKIWLEDELAYLGECPWQEDISYAQAVCKQAGVPFEVVPLQQEYWDNVVSYAIRLIKAGQTPNPDMLCNQKIKFGAFFDKILPEFEKVATGHYAQLVQHKDYVELATSPDPIKDQTYFLSQLSQQQLQRALFPIGHLTKQEVRALAHEDDLATKDRKDSQGICFLGKIKFDEFVKYHLGEKAGKLIEYESGKTVGAHKGYWFYTIGQRQGIGLSGGPWYVVAKNIHDNTVFVSRTYYEPEKERSRVYVTDFNWIVGHAPIARDFMVKLRHGPVMTPAALEITNNQGVVQLSVRDQGIAPGQFVAFYDKNICHGSALISQESVTRDVH